jgi:plastocyanin
VIIHAALAVVAVVAPGPAQVSIVDDAFRPRTLAVSRGRPVTWRWQGRRRHDVWFARGPARCRPRRSGSCTRRFRQVGRYEYFCTLHGSMAGVVRVRRHSG